MRSTAPADTAAYASSFTEANNVCSDHISGRADDSSHTQSHTGAIATSNTATNVFGALTRADARAKPGADAAANPGAQPGADALADARVVPRRQLRRRWLRALYAVRGRILRKRAPRDELRALPRRHLQRPAWLGELRRLSVWQILGARFCGLLGVREWRGRDLARR